MDTKITASELKRWIVCPGSTTLENKKKYEDEGTLAHALANFYVNYNLKRITQEEFKEVIKIIKGNKYFNENMDENLKKYTRWVFDYIKKISKVTDKMKIFTEKK